MTAVEAAKKADTVQSLILIMGDLDAKKVLVAWTLYGANCRDRKIKGEKYVAADLKMVWSSVDVDFERLSILAGLPFSTTVIIFERLKEARIIFPDGTATANAMIITQGDVQSYLKSLMKIK